MSVSLIDAWRKPGCGIGCTPRTHDHEAHEAYGFGLALMAQRVAPLQTVTTGGLAVDLLACTATVEGRRVHLTPREWGLLACIARRHGQVVPNDDIVREVWGEAYLAPGCYSRDGASKYEYSRHLINVNLARLRDRLGPAGSLIVTVTWIGRRLEIVGPTP